MDGGGGEHRPDDDRGAERGEQTESDQRAAGHLGQAGQHGHPPARSVPDGVEEACGAAQPGPAEPTQELLGAMPDEQQPEHDTDDQQSKSHRGPLLPSSGSVAPLGGATGISQR